MTKPGAIEWWHCLDVWTSLGGHPAKFDEWIAEPRRTRADAWAQLMAAIKGDVPVLLKDSNPPAGALLEIVESYFCGNEPEDFAPCRVASTSHRPTQ